MRAAMSGEGKRTGRTKAANDNRAPAEEDARATPDATERLDVVALAIARLIGRRMAREDYEKAICAANDNMRPSSGETGPKTEDGD